MAPDATYYDEVRDNPEVIDPPKNEDMVEVSEQINDHTQLSAKANLADASSVRELLECPVCLNAMYPPIHQCSNGHTLCSGCKPRVHNRCPTCRHELGNIRCLALEKDDHKVDMHSGSSFNHRYVKSNPHEVENATWMLTVFSCFGQYFCLHFEAFQLGTSPVYIAFLRFMGDDSEAKSYSYSLEVGGYGRKITWQGVPRSIRDSHRKVRDSYDGLIIQRNMALFFSGGDRKELKLRVTGRIWKEQ
ncbi:E3 ubiquitin-protein ligase DIS1-like isoform X2 [Zingiber officinale]|uniref:E3 ubiquitin-protein ligase DIS1-like isoform X2 n=1 Tax=Zingiber officinale TaxID=94328 RepID=UPI001C4B8BCE|nr:E3 ubiquitin-protein ligase DIS1-like isoform X2 [Zingiber officinale]XP_042474208.1 E3 ubiquitin-protein ligase DIS1-like isoform X2 [Zingiber officinale]